ncbi:type II toxin-antitoxin system RelE/ParE family toxin [Amantichitinum ursilacus]|uniref:Phage-related protein n=1 Tax=Amantichitinum ursilacus TaxID=857265 RepID=A0A0N0GQ64_9NEIS|nr:type II toxin-antitoxin system RelE/ParE family toxin [Amantichitinum ursilacus]KPC54403.1 hypothetical protein WG78_02440 [Amantichitinum ursilacus]
MYIGTQPPLRRIAFVGSALKDLRDFPQTARRDAGQQLDQLQRGLEPDDWKPISTVGKGAREIRLHDETGAYRVIYVARLAHAIYVLHCFQKKSQKTSRPDLELAEKRYRELMKEQEK